MFKIKLFFISILLFFISNNSINAQSMDIVKINEQNCVKGEIIIKFKQSIHNLNKTYIQNNKTLLQKKHKVKILKKWKFNAELWKVESENLKSLIDSLNNNPNVEYAEPNYILYADVVPNDTYFSDLWGLNNTGQTGGNPDADIDAPDAWDFTTGDANILVGIIDSGIDYSHPDISANIWTNPNEIADNGIDDDNNGYIDDVHGWDFCNNDNDPMDDNSHGTHVSGIIGAIGNNGIGVSGVAWNVKLVALKFLSSGNSGSTDDAISAIEYSIDNNIKLTNNSWGGASYSQALYDVISIANDSSMLFVAAAGNNSANNDINPHYPSSYDLNNIISVANTNHNDQLANTSNWGIETVDLTAPGSNIYSTLPNNSYGYKSGTSMAAPYVTGTAILIWNIFPEFNHIDIKNQLLGSIDQIHELINYVKTSGRLNAYKSVSSENTPLIEVYPSKISFGAELLNVKSPLRKIYIKNTTSEIVTIDSILVEAPFIIYRDEQYIPNIYTLQIEPGQTDSINVVFEPSSTGEFEKHFFVYHTLQSGISYLQSVSLKGIGVSSGTIINEKTVDGTWNSSHSPYYVNTNIEINNGNKLIITEGVETIFTGHFNIRILETGQFTACGTLNDTIKFYPYYIDEGWNGISFINTGSDDTLRYCSFKQSKKYEIIYNGNNHDEWIESGSGGAIFVSHSIPFITDNLIYKNYADIEGGGICYNNGSAAFLFNNKILNNYSKGSGGGILIEGSTDLIYSRINNNLISNNSANGGGGFFIRNFDSVDVISNNTICYNKAFGITGGGLYLQNFNASFINNIVYFNYALEDPQLHIESSSPLIENCGIEGGFYGNGNLPSNPHFTVEASGVGSAYDAILADFQLQDSSSYINSGRIDTAGLHISLFDSDNNNRIFGNIIDIGSYENQSSVPQISTYPYTKINFGSLLVGDSSVISLILFSGSDNLTIENVEIFNNYHNAFKIEQMTYPFTIPANDSIAIASSFKPDSTCTFAADLQISSNSYNFPTKFLQLEGLGYLGTAILGGEITGIWEKEFSPYNIMGNIFVKENDSLVIEPGVNILFQGHYYIKVTENAKFIALGAENDSIKFTANDTTTGWFGIRIINSGSDDKLEYCVIKNSKKDPSSIDEDQYGGGVYFHNTTSEVSHCNISHNKAYEGSAIYCGRYSNVNIQSNFISNNTGHGAIELIDNSNVQIIGNSIVHNINNESNGGGILTVGGDFFVEIFNNLISNNKASHGAGISISGGWGQPYANISNNIIVNNSCIYHGGGIKVGDYVGIISIKNNTISNNVASNGGGISTTSSEASLYNNIIWGNVAESSDPQIYNSDENALIEYCNIQDWDSGVGNISENPLFINPTDSAGISEPGYLADWHFQANSPCIDSGTPDTSGLNIPKTDLDGNERIWNGRIDIGPYEFGSGPPSTIEELNEKIPLEYSLSQNYPNPFNPHTSIRFGLPEPSKVKIEIYNLLGQKIETVLNDNLKAGYHNVTFDGSAFASGMYFYRIVAGNFHKVKKMLLLK